MKKVKRVLSILFIVCMLAAVTLTASAASGKGDGKVKWTYENGVLTLSGKGEMENHVPAGAGWGSWVNKNVANATNYRIMGNDVERIVVSKNVTGIGDAAFTNCYNSKEARIADSVKYIGGWAFMNNESMTSVYIPSSVKTIYRMAFYQCDKLKDVYYAGSKADWKKITIKADNEDLLNANFHYNVEGIDTPVVKKDQKIKGTGSYSKTVGNAAFNLKASAKTDLTYVSNNTSVVTVSKKGKVTIKGAGEAAITIKAAGNKNFNAAEKVVTIKVAPQSAKLSGVTRKNGTTAILKWNKVKKVDGYEIQICSGKGFTNPQVLTAAASSQKITVNSLVKGQKYFTRMRTYKVNNGKTYYSKWSSVKTIKKK